MEKQNVITNQTPAGTQKTAEVVDQAVDMFAQGTAPKEGVRDEDHGKDSRPARPPVSGRV